MKNTKIKVRRSISKPPTLKRSLFISAFVHILIVLIFILFPQELFENINPPLDFVWVELPKGTGEDIYGLKESKSLPESTIQEQKEAIQEALKPLKEEQKAKELMPEPKVPEKKAQKKPEPKKPSAMDAALAKIDKRLKKRTVEQEAAQVESSGVGYKYGTSDEPNRIPVDDPEYIKYQAMVRYKIENKWLPPASVEQLPREQRPIVRIIVLIGRDGDVISKRWAKKSNIESLNASAMRAVDGASPLPIPPERIKWEAYNEGFLVEFNAQKR